MHIFFLMIHKPESWKFLILKCPITIFYSAATKHNSVNICRQAMRSQYLFLSQPQQLDYLLIILHVDNEWLLALLITETLTQKYRARRGADEIKMFVVDGSACQHFLTKYKIIQNDIGIMKNNFCWYYKTLYFR